MDKISKILGNFKWRHVDMGDGTHAPTFLAWLPKVLLTGTTNPRVRVDVGQTSFFEGREFRSFKEFDIPNTETYTIKAVVPVNTILQGLEIELDQGFIRFLISRDGVESGTFAEALPIIPANTMTDTPAYSPQVTLNAGGSVAGGVVIDVVRIKVENATGAADTSTNPEENPRGVGPETYYLSLVNNGSGNATGVIRARWEERP